MDNKLIKSELQKAVKLIENGSVNDAQHIFNGLVPEKIEDTENLLLLGDLAKRLGETVSAIEIFSDLVIMHPDSAVHTINLAQAYADNGMLNKAEELFQEAIRLNPDLYESHFRLGKVFINQGRYSEATEPLEKALALKPGNSEIYINLVTAYTHSDQHEEAYRYAQKLVRLEPKIAESYHLLGRVLSGLGQFDEAITNFEKAISLNKTFGHSYIDLSRIKKFDQGDKKFIEDTEKVLKLGMSSEQRAAILFSLGKIYNDCKEWDKAFDYYRQGNLVHKAAFYDMLSDDVFNKTHKSYNIKLFKEMAGSGSDSQVPVFVVGMPRSGTTLIEQIISSHPQAAGAGELMTMPYVNASICAISEIDSFKQKFSAVLNQEDLQQRAEGYLSVLQHSREDAVRVVDKLPDNFLYLGLIHLLFPRAVIVHAVRSPIDTSLSCYFQIFRDLGWANDLEWIARRYNLYRKAMAYWNKVIPEDRIIECRYEDMVADPVTQSKRLIEGIGLEWDESCLNYHEQDQAINTASLWQARQPIYKTSSKRWLNYAKHLTPLLKGINQYIDDEDRQELAGKGVKLKKKWLSNIF